MVDLLWMGRTSPAFAIMSDRSLPGRAGGRGGHARPPDCTRPARSAATYRSRRSPRFPTPRSGTRTWPKLCSVRARPCAWTRFDVVRLARW